MAIQSQRSRKSATTKRRARSETVTPFHETLSKALRALWDQTDNNGVRNGNGKQTVLIEALKVTPNQADHINECLKHLGLLQWSGKGRGATYKVDKALVEVTPEMAAKAIEAVGPSPKAKAIPGVSKSGSKQTRTRRTKVQPSEPASTPAQPELKLDELDVSGLADNLPEVFDLLEQATNAYAELSNRYEQETQHHEATKRQLADVQHDLGVAQNLINKITTGYDSKKIEEIISQARLVMAPTQ